MVLAADGTEFYSKNSAASHISNEFSEERIESHTPNAGSRISVTRPR